MLSSKVYRTGAEPTLPTYDENLLRARAGLDAGRVSGFDGLVEAAVKAFEDETAVKLRASAFTASFGGGALLGRAGGYLNRLTVPGMNAAVTSVTFDGATVQTADYRTWADDANGSMHVEPVRGKRWDACPDSEFEVAFTAGVAALPPDVQEIVGVRIRYDYYGEEGDGLAFIHRCQPYNYLRSQR